MRGSSFAGFLVIVLCAGSTATAEPANETHDPPLAEQYLIEGKLAEGEEALKAKLAEHPDDDQLRFGLGAIQFLGSVERLMQSLYHYGTRSDLGWGVPFLRLPIPSNPEPASLTYPDQRRFLEDFTKGLEQSAATLSEIKNPEVKLPLRFGLIRLDIDGNGKATDEEALWRIYAKLTLHNEITADIAERFVLAFDRGDVHWLRGYCHLLSALCEMILAYDRQRVFDHVAPSAFAKPKTPYPFLIRSRNPGVIWEYDVRDAIAFIHLIDLEVTEPQRLLRALKHLETTIAQSRESWKHILAETDNDHEWIPHPDQTGVMPNLVVTKQVVEGWMRFLDEAEAVLAGKKLIPFWRPSDSGKGVNLRRVFTEPRRFDLALWVQGTAAAPYLEEGPRTNRRFWLQLRRLFEGRFLSFAVWFN